MNYCMDCGCKLITRDEKLDGICDFCYWDDYYWFDDDFY